MSFFSHPMIRKALFILIALFIMAACGRKGQALRPDVGAPTYGPGEVNMQPTSDPSIAPVKPASETPRADSTK
jgi:hypothetical protein